MPFEGDDFGTREFRREVIHQTADLLATMGRSATPVSPPGEVFLTDLSILLTFFVVD